MSKLPPPPGAATPPAPGASIPMPPVMRPLPPLPSMPGPAPSPAAPSFITQIQSQPRGLRAPPPGPAVIVEHGAHIPPGRVMTPGVDFDPITGEVFPTPSALAPQPAMPPAAFTAVATARPLRKQTADDITGNYTPAQRAVKAAVNNWYVARARKIMAEREERDARDEMLRLAFPDINWDSKAYAANAGTKRFVVGDGTKVKASLQDTYKIENSEEADKAVAKLPTDIAEMLIEWKPNLKKGVYQELKDEYKVIIAPFVTIQANAPQVELEE